MNITDICLRNPVLAWMLMVGTILFGIIAVTRIGVSQFPDVDNPTVTVSVSWPGASPEDVETGIINPIEDAMSQVTGVHDDHVVGQARLGARHGDVRPLAQHRPRASGHAGQDRADAAQHADERAWRPSSRRATRTTSRS